MTDPTFIGFGEAAMAFARSGARGYDRLLDDPANRDAKLADFAASGVRACSTLAEALAGTEVALSLVWPKEVVDAARAAAEHLRRGTLYLDMNSAAPDTKRSAAGAIEAAGSRYVDVAVMAPVLPARRAAPLLVAGPHAATGAQALAHFGFEHVAIAPGGIGAASAVKMIRSVMVKGIEALTAEMMLAAQVAGVEDAVLGSLAGEWRDRATYNLERMATHGRRRADEMLEAARTLEALGVEPVMTRGTIVRQREAAERAHGAAA